MQIPLFGRKLSNSPPWLLGLAAVAALIIGVGTYRVIQSPQSRSQLQQLTVAAQKQNLTLRIEASGTVEPRERVKISPKTSGRLEQLLVEQGDKVTKGQTLAIMENTQASAEVDRAKANLQQAEANLAKAKITVPQEIARAEARLNATLADLANAKARIPRQIEQARARLNTAKSRFELAKQRRDRYQSLQEQGVIDLDRYDEVFNEFQSAEANLLEARQNLQQIQDTRNPEIDRLDAGVAEARLAYTQRLNSSSEDIQSAIATRDIAAAQLKTARVNYEDTFLLAPFDGIITQKEATEGEIVSPSLGAGSSSIVELARGLEIIAKVPEVDVGQLQAGQPVKVIADAYPDRVFEGRVRSIAPEAKIENNVTSFEVRVALLTGLDELRSKMNVDVTFLGEEIQNALVVPTVAIVTENGEPGVIVVGDNNKPQFQGVTLGPTIDDRTQILSGLSAQERVFITLPRNYRRSDR